jgi:hypothetical protein
MITTSCWLGREDSNLRMRVPKTRVLPLDDAPVDSPDAIQDLGTGRLINVKLCRDVRVAQPRCSIPAARAA